MIEVTLTHGVSRLACADCNLTKIIPLENSFSLEASFLGKKVTLRNGYPKMSVPPQTTGGDILTPVSELSGPYAM